MNLGTKNKGLSTSDQESLDEAGIEEVESLILEAAGLMSGSAFLAKHDPTKDSYASGFCDVPQVCPLCDGKQVTQR